ncbi:MAG: M48 family metalloprotease [bacterium]
MRKVHLFHMGLILARLFAAGWLLTCAVNPVTGKRELMLMSQAQEIRLGRESDSQIVAAYGVYEDSALAQYINDLGQRMVRISHRPNLQFTFRVLDSPVVNAFALPGGFVYATRGILAYMNNEAELAGVLGHEIGHVTARHSAKQYSKAQLASLGLGVGKILSEDFRRYAGLAEFGVGLLFLRFSRDNERQSDELGVEYATKVGYDGSRMSDFFTTIERLGEGPRQGGLPGWFSTHPNPADRVEATRRLAAEWQQRVGPHPWQVNREPYLKMIDGLVYGEDPRQGYVEENTFYHPTLQFQFPVPRGWQVTNLPTQVQMVSKEKDAAITLSLKEGKNPRSAALEFIDRTKGQVHSAEALTVSGLQAYRLLSDLQSGEMRLRVLSYFIVKEGYIFILHGLSTIDRFALYRDHFRRTATNFAPTRDPEISNIEPMRIKIVQVEATAPLRTALGRSPRAEVKEKDLALLNGMALDEVVTAGTLIKVIASKEP